MRNTEMNPPAATSAFALPPPPTAAAATATATTDTENPPSDDYAPVPPAQVAAQTDREYDRMDAAIIETVAVAQRIRTDHLMPPAQTAAAYDDMENANNVLGNDAPIPPVQISDQYDVMENAIKTSIEDKEKEDTLDEESNGTTDSDDSDPSYSSFLAMIANSATKIVSSVTPRTPSSFTSLIGRDQIRDGAGTHSSAATHSAGGSPTEESTASSCMTIGDLMKELSGADQNRRINLRDLGKIMMKAAVPEKPAAAAAGRVDAYVGLAKAGPPSDQHRNGGQLKSPFEESPIQGHQFGAVEATISGSTFAKSSPHDHVAPFAATHGHPPDQNARYTMPDTETNPPAAAPASAAAATIATTSTDNEHPSSVDYAPVPPAQTAADYDRMDAAIKETVAQSLRTDPPLPPAQTAADYDRMDAAIKESTDDVMGNDAPIPPAQIGDQYHAMENAIKTSIVDNENDGDVPLPPSTAAARLDDDDEENQNQKPKARTGTNKNDAAPRMAVATPPPVGRDADIQAQSPASTSRRSLLPLSLQIFSQMRPPASSTPQSRTEDTDQATNPAQPPPQREPSAAMLVATPVRDMPVYYGVQVSDAGQQVVEEEKQSWLKRKQTYFFGAVGLLLGTAVVAGPSFRSNSNDEFAPSGSPTESVSPSSSSRPSESTPPSQNPSTRPSLGPSLSSRPSYPPSSWPSHSPSLSEFPSSSSLPSSSLPPTLKSCQDRLREQIYDVSVRVGTVDQLQFTNSPQYLAREWILEEWNTTVPIDPFTASQILLNEQRYALAVMYFSLGGDNWNAGNNPGNNRNARNGRKLVDKDAPPGTWLSGLNYCEWGTEISGADGSYNQLVCDEFGNVLNLNLQSNNMIGPIPPEIGVLVYMSSYISFFNAQSGPIPTSLGLLAPLQTFDVESNNMEGELFQPEYSGPNGLTEVVNFRASLNNFRGNIPKEIGRWTRLQNLWFADNEITGTIPREVGNLVDMNAFLFYKNKIAGTIPDEIGNLDKLTWIDMEDNQIVGTIPQSFYSNLDLEEVIFKNNSLSGTISDRVGDLSKLATFWASFNQLSGEIPTTFGECLKLEELELQNNVLTGSLPEEFGNMESAEFLSIESNKLTGTIPPRIFGQNIPGLRILYLNGNELSGPVPENYGQSPRLKDLWMNDNVLTGMLPIIAEGEFLFLEELLINNNEMTGEVDDSLCLIRNDTIPGGNLGVFHADCQPPTGGGAPQIVCSCCTACFV